MEEEERGLAPKCGLGLPCLEMWLLQASLVGYVPDLLIICFVLLFNKWLTLSVPHFSDCGKNESIKAFSAILV